MVHMLPIALTSRRFEDAHFAIFYAFVERCHELLLNRIWFKRMMEIFLHGGGLCFLVLKIDIKFGHI
jgi:hypothetical protein